MVLFSFQNFLLSLHRYVYGEGPVSQNDFFGIVIYELPDAKLDNQTPLSKPNI